MPSRSDQLATINAAQQAAIKALRSYVCELEQAALDAAKRRDYNAAKLQSDWAFAADLCILKVSTALSTLFLETCSAPPIKEHSTVELPSLERPTGDEEIQLATVHVLHPEKPKPPAA